MTIWGWILLLFVIATVMVYLNYLIDDAVNRVLCYRYEDSIKLKDKDSEDFDGIVDKVVDEDRIMRGKLKELAEAYQQEVDGAVNKVIDEAVEEAIEGMQGKRVIPDNEEGYEKLLRLRNLVDAWVVNLSEHFAIDYGWVIAKYDEGDYLDLKSELDFNCEVEMERLIKEDEYFNELYRDCVSSLLYYKNAVKFNADNIVYRHRDLMKNVYRLLGAVEDTIKAYE